MNVRPVRVEDRPEWLRMRCALWPECPASDHAREVEAQLSGRTSDGVPSVVLVAERAPGDGRLCGFVELSVKPLDGFESHPVTYVEGWYVDADVRRTGIGRALVAAAEAWAVDRGCAEIGSGCDVTNRVSHAAHLALGFQPIDDLIFFRKRLAPAAGNRPTPQLEGDWTELLGVPLLAREAVKFVTHPDAGGIDVFLGTTRAERDAAGRELVALDYEAYAEMAEQQLRGLAARARERWPVLRLALLHRTGRVPVGEPSVLIAVATPHRGEAFEACRWLIDTLKAEVAVWKKEVWADGTGTWVHPEKQG